MLHIVGQQNIITSQKIGVSHTACKDDGSTKSSISQRECILIFFYNTTQGRGELPNPTMARSG